MSNPPLASYRPATCKTGLATTPRMKRVHKVVSMRTAIANGRLYCRAEFACGTSHGDVLVLAGAEPLGICPRCDLAGWFVYHCYDAAGRLLYIGSTGCRYLRFKDHARKSPWWPEVADIKFTEYASEAETRMAEVVAICAERPLHNKEHNRPELVAA